jgi:hypothetical protein
MLEAIKVPIKKLKFVRGTGHQFSEKYILDVYRLAPHTSHLAHTVSAWRIYTSLAEPPKVIPASHL